MSDGTNELPDEEAVEFSSDMRRAIEDDEAASSKAAAPVEDAPESDDETGGTQESDDEDTHEDGDSDGDDDTPEEEHSAGGVKPKRPGNTARERIAELAKKRRDAEKAAFDAEMRVIELEKRLSERGDTVAEVAKAPDPSDFTYGEVDPDYLLALVDHKVAQRTAEIRDEATKKEREASSAKLMDHYKAKLADVMASGKKRFKDFDETVNGVRFDPEIALMILNSENAVDIAYHLGNNIADLREMTKADSTGRARMLGRLEGRYSATSAVKKKSNAPETPGTRATRPAKEADAQYGPEDQDAFDKAFFG